MKAELLLLVPDKLPSKDSQNRRMWREKKIKSHFLVTLTYFVQNTVKGDNNIVSKELWSLYTIPKATFLSWRILLDRIPTKGEFG